jgi:hypothetical protein
MEATVTDTATGLREQAISAHRAALEHKPADDPAARFQADAVDCAQRVLGVTVDPAHARVSELGHVDLDVDGLLLRYEPTRGALRLCLPCARCRRPTPHAFCFVDLAALGEQLEEARERERRGRPVWCNDHLPYE